MGTGKTCLCIALITLTRYHFSRPTSSPDLTISIESLPSSLTNQETFPSPPSHPVPTLSSLAVKAIALNGIPWRRAPSLPLGVKQILEASRPYYTRSTEHTRSGRGVDPSGRWEGRSWTSPATQRIYLGSGTLVIVPPNLVGQWRSELLKHAMDGYLRVLVVERPKDLVPSLDDLLAYDLVLFSTTRFSLERSRGEARSCKCKDLDPRRKWPEPCTHKPAYTSPLLYIHWRRIIVDEGHSLSTSQSELTRLAMAVPADCRWICTGTPTRHLVADAGFNGILEGNARSGGIGAEAERRDLATLGRMVGGFLSIPPWTSSLAWRNWMVKPFLTHLPGSEDRLARLMHRIMVRNQPQDVDRSIQIPPLYERTHHLPLHPLARLTYNALVALQHVNTVTSERVGPDYLFHEKNRKRVIQLLDNLGRASFWLNLPNLSDIEASPAVVEEYLALRAQGKRQCSKEDVALLYKSVNTLQEVLHHPVWRSAMASGDLGAHIHLPSLDQELDLSKLLHLPKDFYWWGKGGKDVYVRMGDLLRLRQVDQRWVHRLSLLNSHAKQTIGSVTDEALDPAHLDALILERELQGSTTSPNHRAQVERSVQQDSGDPLNGSPRRTDGGKESELKGKEREEESTLEIMASSLSGAWCSGTWSSKLDYLLSRLLYHKQIDKEKSLVFTHLDVEMHYLHQALHLSGIRSLQYHGQGMVSQWVQGMRCSTPR